MATVLLAWAVVLPAAALAADEIKDFKPPAEMTPEELEASKARSRLPVNAYSKQISDEVTPIPWKAIILFSVIILLATPYALRYYRATAGDAVPERKKSPSPSAAARERAANEETKVRNTGPAGGDTRVPVRRNTRS
ncbi:MAG TPA: hypothetical protein VIG99_19645 [Myxococcaceae bacterium]|jgi:hypothetical protein